MRFSENSGFNHSFTVGDLDSTMVVSSAYWGGSTMGARVTGMKTSVDGFGGSINAEGGKATIRGRGGDGDGDGDGDGNGEGRISI